jgi:hypothetical protein
MRTFKQIIGFPIIIVIQIYALYVTYKIVQDSDMSDLMGLENEKDLKKHLDPHLTEFYEKNKIILILFCVLIWLCILKFILKFIFGF